MHASLKSFRAPGVLSARGAGGAVTFAGPRCLHDPRAVGARASLREEVAVEELLAPADACAEWKLELCRLAVGAPLDWPVAALAAHARGCPGCARWVDELAACRAWLERRVAATREPEVSELARRASSALDRELAARLARDLHDDALARPGRPRTLRRRDLRRLLALRGPRAFQGAPWPQVVRLVLRPVRPRLPPSARRAAALRLAARLDPLGLDVALGHLAALEREGRNVAADAEADRLLALVG
jgi:hypothetical protein